MKITMQAPLNPRPIGSAIHTPQGPGIIEDYSCPNGTMLYIVDVPCDLGREGERQIVRRGKEIFRKEGVGSRV